MEQITLEVEPREEQGKSNLKDVRGKGYIPAVIYGGEKKTESIKISRSAFLKLLHQHHLENAILNIQIQGGGRQALRPCLIKEMQNDPVNEEILHIDFYEVSLTESIKVKVPVVAKGEPIGVKVEGGSLEHLLWEIEVECLPTDIPQEIAVDVSQLKIGESIHIKDLSIPANVSVLQSADTIVLAVAEPMKEEVPAEAVEGEAPQEPEVIKEKKEAPAEESESQEEEKK